MQKLLPLHTSELSSKKTIKLPPSSTSPLLLPSGWTRSSYQLPRTSGKGPVDILSLGVLPSSVTLVQPSGNNNASATVSRSLGHLPISPSVLNSQHQSDAYICAAYNPRCFIIQKVNHQIQTSPSPKSLHYSFVTKTLCKTRRTGVFLGLCEFTHPRIQSEGRRKIAHVR